VVVATEVEALTLEYAWIKEFDPRFNVRYRDDKSYPFLAVTVGEEFPRAMVMRGDKRPGVRYFGPFAHAWAIRETVDQLLRVFPMRTCTRGVFRRAQASGRPCLLGYIDKCAAPCIGQVTADEHRAIVEDFCAFMAGNSAAFVRSRTEQMNAAAAELDYERAARLRDDLYALQRVLERNAVVLPDGTDADVVGLASDELEACVRVFHVRDGRIRGSAASSWSASTTPTRRSWSPPSWPRCTPSPRPTSRVGCSSQPCPIPMRSRCSRTAWPSSEVPRSGSRCRVVATSAPGWRP
jgi:excinuclease ABC subunit C